MNRQLIVILAIFGPAETEAYEFPRIDQNLFGRIIRNLQPAGRPPKDREWWRQVRPWLRHLSKILKFVPKLSDLAKAYDEQWYKAIDLSVEIYDAAADAFPEFVAQTERSARRELDVVMGKEVEAEGAALRALHVFLREADKTQHWCGLKKVVTNDGNILWLCAEHARFQRFERLSVSGKTMAAS